MKLANLKVADRPQKILVYGAPKSGKSLLVGRLAEHGYDLYWFDGDNGIDVLFQLPPEAQERVTVFPVRDLGSNFEFAKLSNEFAGYRDFTVCEQHGAVNCVSCKAKQLPTAAFKWAEVVNNPKAVIVFDSLSQLVTSIQNYVARNDKFDDFGSLNKESKREWGHYMAQGLVLGKFYSMIQNAPCKVVCISHETDLDPEKNPNAKVTIPTGGTSTQSKTISKYFGHVVNCRIRNNQHKIVSGTTSDPNAVAGSRLNIELSKDPRGLAAMFETSAPLEQAASEQIEDLKEALPSVEAAENKTTVSLAARMSAMTKKS